MLQELTPLAEEIRAQRAASPETQARKLAIAIYGALGPYAISFYNRDNLFEKRLYSSILRHQSLPIVGFWGVGGKQRLDQHDERLLAEYEVIRATVREIYPQAVAITLILADAHGRFNGYDGSGGYLEEIAGAAQQRGIASVSLDRLYGEWGISLPDPGVPVNPQSAVWQEFQRIRQRPQLIESAAKHNKLGIDPESAAYYYWLMRRQEREPLSQTFPRAILFVNGSEDLGRTTLPLDMPQMYSRVKPPWFSQG